MAEGKCASCARYMLIIFNLIFWIAGIVLIGVGIWAVVSDVGSSALFEHLQPMGEDVLNVMAYTAIGVGSFMFFIGFCGCCGALRESAFMLVVYMIFMVVLLLAELGACIYGAIEKPSIEEMLQKQLRADVRNYNGTNSTLDFIQIQFKCCGANNHSDYHDNYFFGNISTDKYVPDSCCLTKDNKTPVKPIDGPACQAAARTNDVTSKYLHTRGCYIYFKDLVDNNSSILIGVMAAIVVLEILGIVFAVYLCRNRTDYDYYEDRYDEWFEM